MHLRDMKYRLATLVGTLEDRAVTVARSLDGDAWAVTRAQVQVVDTMRTMACAVVEEETRTLTEPQIKRIRDTLALWDIILPE